MPVFLARVLNHIVRARSWTAPLLVALFVFATSWPLMLLAEGASSGIVQPGNYWWWFVVTAATVGYGDFYPETVVGHFVGGYVIIGGIATLTALFARLAATIERARGRRMQGSITVDQSEHIVILGYTPGRSEHIVDELLAEARRPVTLCAWDEVTTHPMSDRGVDFVRGDLTDPDVLRRAGVDRAHSVLVDPRDDNEGLAMAVTVDHVRPDVHLVVALRDLDRTPHLRYVNSGTRCVRWHTPRMITEELQDPGITQIYEELMTHGGAGNTYSTALPGSIGQVSYGTCQTALGRSHAATVLAARSDSELLVSPSWDTTLNPGTVLYYVSQHRITPEQLTAALRTKGNAG